MRKRDSERTPLSELEQGLARKLAGARYPCYSAAKRFSGDLAAGYVKALSPRGRRFMARVTYRFRRQYALTEAEWEWVRQWQNWEEVVQADPPDFPPSLRRFLDAEG